MTSERTTRQEEDHRMYYHPTPPRGARSKSWITAAIALGIVVAGASQARAGDPQVSCRKALSKSLATVAATGFKVADKCHKGVDKICTPNSGRANCNDTATFDPDAKYSGAKANATIKIDAACTASPILTNYPPSHVIETEVYPLI